MKNKKKIINLFLLIILIVISLAYILPQEIGDFDEIWNYNFAKQMAAGKLPYRDFNIIITPLFPMICSIFLTIFGNHLIVMRIIGAILLGFIFFTTYILLDKLGINTKISMIIIEYIFYMFMNILVITYNFASIFLILIILYIEITKSEKILKKDFKTDFIIGILAGLTILTKQSTGLIFAITVVGYKILTIKCKKDIKEYLKIFLARSLGVLIPVFITIIYFAINGIMDDFINYAILGIREFTNYISYKELLRDYSIYKLLAIFIPTNTIITFILAYITYRKGKENNKINNTLLIISSYAIANFSMVYPISDDAHFSIASTISIILLFYNLYLIFIKLRGLITNKKIIFLIKYMIKYLALISIIYLICTSTTKLFNYYINLNKYNKIKQFEYIPMDETTILDIESVDNFIINVDKDIIILECDAPLFMIPLNKYHKNYDMLLKGNLGLNGEQKIIDELMNIKETYVLIFNDKIISNWQTPENIIKYIKNNWEKIGEIEHFDIYDKK